MIEKENCINLESSLAMVAPKACLMIHSVVGCELVDQVHRLFACGAFCCCSLECHFLFLFFLPLLGFSDQQRETDYTHNCERDCLVIYFVPSWRKRREENGTA